MPEQMIRQGEGQKCSRRIINMCRPRGSKGGSFQFGQRDLERTVRDEAGKRV